MTATTASLSRRHFFQASIGAAALTGAVPAWALARPDDKLAPALPSSGVQGGGFYKLTLGATDIIILADGSFANDASGPAGTFGSNAGTTPETARAAVEGTLTASLLPANKTYFFFNAIVIRQNFKGGETILVDTGCGAGMGATAGLLQTRLAAAGIKPSDVSKVFFTHLHPDHFGGLLTADDSVAFANARVLMHESERDFWSQESPDLSGNGVDEGFRQMMVVGAKKTIAAVPKNKLDVVADGDALADGVRVVHAPGHTPGHSMIEVSAAGQTLWMIGDLAHHHVLSFQQPSWHVAFDTDQKQGATTRAKFMKAARDLRVQLMGYHMPFPALGTCQSHGEDHYRWVASEWKW